LYTTEGRITEVGDRYQNKFGEKSQNMSGIV